MLVHDLGAQISDPKHLLAAAGQGFMNQDEGKDKTEVDAVEGLGTCKDMTYKPDAGPRILYETRDILLQETNQAKRNAPEMLLQEDGDSCTRKPASGK